MSAHVNADPRAPITACSARRRPVYLVTSADQPDLGHDDQVLQRALSARGIPCKVAVWTDATVDWAAAGVCIIRSVWDYHLDPDRFRSWLAMVEAVSTVLNPPHLVRWNMHKRYLRQLAASGVPTIETIWITLGSQVTLSDVLADRGWSQALIKPAVSASAWKTAKVRAGEQRGQDLVNEILAHSDVMVQPYLDSIDRDGEVSVIAVEGEITHAVRRVSALVGDIETARLGSAHAITEDERRLATQVMALLPAMPVYARIDLVRDQEQRLLLGELELIEPVLYLRHGPKAVQELVTRLARYTVTTPVHHAAGSPDDVTSNRARPTRCGPLARRNA